MPVPICTWSLSIRCYSGRGSAENLDTHYAYIIVNAGLVILKHIPISPDTSSFIGRNSRGSPLSWLALLCAVAEFVEQTNEERWTLFLVSWVSVQLLAACAWAGHCGWRNLLMQSFTSQWVAGSWGSRGRHTERQGHASVKIFLHRPCLCLPPNAFILSTHQKINPLIGRACLLSGSMGILSYTYRVVCFTNLPSVSQSS